MPYLTSSSRFGYFRNTCFFHLTGPSSHSAPLHDWLLLELLKVRWPLLHFLVSCREHHSTLVHDFWQVHRSGTLHHWINQIPQWRILFSFFSNFASSRGDLRCWWICEMVRRLRWVVILSVKNIHEYSSFFSEILTTFIRASKTVMLHS